MRRSCLCLCALAQFSETPKFHSANLASSLHEKGRKRPHSDCSLVETGQTRRKKRRKNEKIAPTLSCVCLKNGLQFNLVPFSLVTPNCPLLHLIAQFAPLDSRKWGQVAAKQKLARGREEKRGDLRAGEKITPIWAPHYGASSSKRRPIFRCACVLSMNVDETGGRGKERREEAAGWEGELIGCTLDVLFGRKTHEQWRLVQIEIANNRLFSIRLGGALPVFWADKSAGVHPFN